jgi:hypothetical protein
MIMNCTREFFTHGGLAATRKCGKSEGVVACCECAERFCKDCQTSTPVFNVNGKPTCEDCLPPTGEYELWEP